MSLWSGNLFSQNPPAIEWQNISWADEDLFDNYQSQENSGEDWWFNHQNVYNGSGIQTGYVTVGYSSLIVRNPSDFTQAQLVFNEGPLSPFNPVTTTGGFFDFMSAFPEGCGDRDKFGQHRTKTRGQVALNDMNGNMIWCKSLCVGELGGVIQDGNYFYVVGLHIGITAYNDHTNFLSYNPTPAFPNQNFSGLSNDPADNGKKVYVAKIDMNGDIVWQALYGMPLYNAPGSAFDAMTSTSYGYGIIKNSVGNIVVTGHANLGAGLPRQAFLAEIDINSDPNNGYLIRNAVLPIGTLSASKGTPDLDIVSEGHALVEIGTSQTYAVAAIQGFGIADDAQEATVWIVDAIFNPIGSPIRRPGDDGINFSSNIFDIEYHQANNEIIVPVDLNCSFCSFANDAGNFGEGKIYRYNSSGVLSGGTNPSIIGLVAAYDLRVGVTETSDGGFIAVSSQKTAGVPPPSTGPILGYMFGCTAINTSVWDTDPIVVKYNSTGAEEWRKTFDVIPGRVREQPLGDLKQQECLYKITEAQDGGYVVSGNSSHNLDDNYLFKLYNDCSVKQVYTKTDPTDNIIDITGSVTWSGPQSVLGSVKVLAGATLTINTGAIIQFADSKLTGILTNVDVQKGGKLIVKSGATLTSIAACPNSMWDGIIIEGTTGKQIAANQGWVVLSTCELKNARRGVFVGGVVKNSGGIIQATHATFRNNYTDVEFAPYAAPLVLGNEPKNISSFSFCNFIGDAFLNDPSYVDAFLPIAGRLTNNTHVILRGVKGIGFAGNNFITDVSPTGLGSSYRTELRSRGIYSIDASFTVQRACNIIGPGGCAGAQNNFDNLYYGVYAQSSNPLKTFTVDQTNFTNCYYSLLQSGTNYSTVTKNNFEINTTIAAPIVPLCPGGPCLNYFDYTNQCSGFNHSENNFKVIGGQQVIGSVFNNTGTSYKETYNNNYTGLKIGTQSQQTNGVNATINGLQIKCNLNTGVITSDITSTSGVIPNQGSCATVISPPSNEFSSSTLAESDIKVSSPANNFIYSYQLLPSMGPQIPTQITTTKVGTNPCVIFNYIRSLACPLPIVGCGFPCWFGLAVSNSASEISAKQVLLAGDAISLYAAINSSMGAGSLKNLLISKSPYLSDSILIMYLLTAPPSGNIKDVIIANSPVTSKVKAVIDNMSLPNGILNQINSAQVGISARQQQEDLVAYYNSQKQLAIDASIRFLLNDTIIANTDSIIETLLKFDGTIKGKTDLTSLYINKGDYTSAQQLIDSISALPGMNKHSKMLQHNKNLHQANKDWFEMNIDAQIKTDIEDLSSDSLADGFANARSIMAMVKGCKNYDLVEDFIEDRSSIININEAEVNVIKNSDENVKLSAFPNPFTDELNVTIDILQNVDANTYVQLIEPVTGRIIQQQLILSNYSALQFRTENLSSGMYLIGVRGTNVNPTFIKLINIR